MNIGIIDFNTGNLKSIIQIFKKIPNNLNIYIINKNFKKFKLIDKIIIPGQGCNINIIINLIKYFDLENFNIIIKNKPVFGICIGKQIFFSNSSEFDCCGLNLFKGFIKKFFLKKNFFKIPKIAWNKVTILKKHKMFKGLKNNNLFYFSNSFYLTSNNKDLIFGLSKYKNFFSSIFIKNNIFLTQFHPEKSSFQGFNIFYNFCNWNL